MHRSTVLFLLVGLVSLVAAPPARAEIKQLRESPRASESLDIGLTEVRIDYHRPAVKGRVIWGQLVPYGEVWRTGANEATTIRFGGPVKIEGKDVPAGTYGFFAIPGPERWTLILSRQADIWGAYDYKPSEDVLRIEVKPAASAPTEWLVYELVPTSDHSARVELAWEKLRVGFNVDVDVHGNYRKMVLEEVGKARPDNAKDWVVYFQAAQYYFKRDMELNQALAWVDQSLKLEQSFWNHELRARILERTGQRKEAIAALTKAIEIAKSRPADKAPPKAYIDNLEKDLAAWRAKKS